MEPYDAAMMQPSSFNSRRMMRRISAGSSKCSNASSDKITSALSSVCVVNTQTSETPRASARLRALASARSRMSTPITRFAPRAATSTASSPSPQPKSITTLSFVSAQILLPSSVSSLLTPSYALPSQ